MFKCVFQALWELYVGNITENGNFSATHVCKWNKAEKLSCLQAAGIFQMVSVRCM